MKYLEDIFNVKIKYKKFNEWNQLPYYINDWNDFKYAEINGIQTLFMYPLYDKNDTWPDAVMFNYNSVKAQLKKIYSIIQVPIVLILNNINSYQRNLLTRNNIAFVVPNKQAYLPFMGIALQESYQKQNLKQLSPSTQMIFLYLIYKQQKLVYLTDIEKDLELNKMAVTRAFKELSFFDGIEISKDGVRRTLSAERSWEEIFTNNINLQIDPIRKKLYIDKIEFKKLSNFDFVYTGETAISKYTMINEPKYKAYAINSNIPSSIASTPVLEDPNSQVCIEIWKYNPAKLSGLFYDGKYIDFLSVYLATNPFDDDRIDKELEIASKKFWKEHNA